MEVEKYFVNKEKGICTCVLSDCEYDAIEEVEHIFGHTCNSLIVKANKDYLIDYRYVGIAKCSPEDTFDEIFGKDLAFERAYVKYIKAKKRVSEKICKNVICKIGRVEEHFNSKRYKDL